MERWTYDGELLQGQPPGVYYRPYVVFNPNTHKYVLWYNWYPKLWEGQAGVAVSDTSVGPFKIVSGNVHLSEKNPGDGSLFVDDDGTGYYIYTAINKNHTVFVERLKPDYLCVTGEISKKLAQGAESPLIFRRNNLYYAMWGPLCLACSNGSPVQVCVAAAPLGPFFIMPDINGSPTNGVPDIPAQETWVANISTSGGPLFIWMADRWGSSPDGINGHDFQFWVPLEFSLDGHILPIKYYARCSVSWSQKN